MSLPKSFVALVLLASTRTRSFVLKDMLCDDEFCTKYIKDKGCPRLSDSCLAQNTTHNGVHLRFPDVCNCCDYCLTNLAEGEPCVTGIAGMLPPTTICGPGLACTRYNGSSTCQPMITDCTKAQIDWDDRRAQGLLGMTEVRPKCDDDGRYAPAHCIPGSICYCVNKKGKRVFGEMPFLHPWDENKMTCGCSINHDKARSSVEPEYATTLFVARCNSYGLFDPLQCMRGSEANCLCVDPINGEPKDATVSKVFNLKQGQPYCFDPSVHNVGTYESECEIMRMEGFEESSGTTTQSSVRLDKFKIPECQPDGKYHRVQILGTKKICVDPAGDQIEKYEADVASPEAKAMNCNCARTKWLLTSSGVTELPSCSSDGSFEDRQCRRGQCFCVDDNGDQIGVEVDWEIVSELYCPNKNQPDPPTSPATATDPPKSVTSDSAGVTSPVTPPQNRL